ncbi:uncharacterized protein LOC132205063 [Neocloeon triangulifer]|uniref:uncharacterized protein LOC132205063 n=1 Tax=Neocloeon triangulifer TaxID=2078957 RepID=UPI00286F6596|nr:uncharacterized protein LOC132205063 [Neocloeon triangulifer]
MEKRKLPSLPQGNSQDCNYINTEPYMEVLNNKEDTQDKKRCFLWTAVTIFAIFAIFSILSFCLLDYYMLFKVVDKTDAARLADEQFQQYTSLKMVLYCAFPRLNNLTTLANNKKYRFNSSNPVTWEVAKKSCERDGLQLASVKNLEDLKAVHQQADLTLKGAEWWLSARDYGKDGKYDMRWIDGTVLERNSSLWHGKAEKKHCLAFYTGGDLRFYGKLCDPDKKHYICELLPECYDYKL